MQEVQPGPIRVALWASQLTCWGMERLIESAAPQFELAGSITQAEGLDALCANTRPQVLVLESVIHSAAHHPQHMKREPNSGCGIWHRGRFVLGATNP